MHPSDWKELGTLLCLLTVISVALLTMVHLVGLRLDLFQTWFMSMAILLAVRRSGRTLTLWPQSWSRLKRTRSS